MPSQFTAQDEQFMQLALAQARRGLGRTRPNPAVGAVVVRDGEVVAVGHHRKAGGAHAEAEALAVAGKAAQGSTLYVTLEPCCHTGRTGPCAEAVIKAGVARVVIGCKDQNPVVNGRGIERLQAAGLDVAYGCLEAECHSLNRAFFCWISRARPLVTLKFAATWDGVIGDSTESRPQAGVRWITGSPARQHAHRLRAMHHAILVGRGTLQADDPQLTVRATRIPAGGSRHMLRVILDSQLQASPDCQLLRHTGGPPPLFIAATPMGPTAGLDQRRRVLENAGAEVLMLPPAPNHTRPALQAVLQSLAKRQVQSLLVEGGSQVLSAFINEALVDRVVAYVAPKLAGGGISITAGPGRGLANSLSLANVTTARLGPDLLLTADVAASENP